MDGASPGDEFLRKFKTTGDWGPDPWFLDPERDRSWAREWAQLGLPMEKRVAADAALRRIFPPEIVKGMKEDVPKWAGQVITLFGGVYTPSLVSNLLHLGVDASLTKPWEDSALLRHLQIRGTHDDAVFETGVHAALARAGAVVRRAPEDPAEKRYDFDVEFRHVQYEVEVKLTRASELDQVADRLSHALMLRYLVVPGFQVALQGSERLAELCWDDLPTLEKAFPEILKAFESAAEDLRSRSVPGIYPAGEWGRILAEPGPEHGSLTGLVLPDLPEEKRTRRVLRKIRDGLEQLTGRCNGILVVGLYGAAQPDHVERLLLEDRKAAATLARKCVMVVLRESIDVPEKGFLMLKRIPLFYAFSPLWTRKLRPAEHKLAVAASSTHWATAIRMDPERPGVVSRRVNTSRRPTKLMGMGMMTAGHSSITATISGSGPPKVEIR